MSNEPKRDVASFDDSVVLPASSVPASMMAVDLTADAEIALAAVRRIEASLQAQYATPPIVALRQQLDETASDIAEARLAVALDHEYGARTVDVEALLQRLAHRVDTMLLAAGAAQPVAPEPDRRAPSRPFSSSTGDELRAKPSRDNNARSEQVPTVQHVFSQLGRPEDAEVAPLASSELADVSFGRAPSFAMLEAMVEALTASPIARAVADREPFTAGSVASTPDARTPDDEQTAWHALGSPFDNGDLGAIPPAHDTADAAEDRNAHVSSRASVFLDEQLGDDATEPEASAVALDGDAAAGSIAAVEAVQIETVEIIEAPAVAAATENAIAETFAAESTPETRAIADETSADAPAPTASVFADPATPLVLDRALIESFARMEAMPYLPPEVGTAVIFSARTEAEPAPAESVVGASSGNAASAETRYPIAASDTENSAQTGFAAATVGLTALAALAPSPAVAVAEDQQPAMQDDEADPAEFLLGPAVDVPSRPDPLAPLRARSAAETIALFT